MAQTRKDFIHSMLCAGAAYAAYGVPENLKESFGAEKLRFGVISDVHVSVPKQQAYFKKALQRLDDWKVDAVLCCGDLADYAMELQLQLVADTWFEVFPDNRSAVDGRPVANLLHYGDHDMQDERYIDYADAAEQWPDRAQRLSSVIHPTTATADFAERAKAAWERCFKCDDWAKVVVKEVKGYKFVLSHFTRGEEGNKYGNNVPGLDELFAKEAFDPEKPFFYSQHRIPKLTACGPTVYGQDDGKTTALFSNYPNLIAFCGHAHENAVQENNIWQGAFTCVQVPSLRYTTSLRGRENAYADSWKEDADGDSLCMPAQSGSSGQGYLVRVYEKAVVIRRWQLVEDKPLGPNWVIPLASFKQPAAERPLNFAVRAAKEPAPQFASDAKVTVGASASGKDRAGVVHQMTTVSFPAARSRWSSPRAQDYEVAVEIRQGGQISLGKVKYVYSHAFHYAEADETQPSKCLFSAEQLPKTGEYRFRVTPRNAWEKGGKPIYSAWIVAG